MRWSPFFQAFIWEITVCPCLLAGIPLGETRSGKASQRLVASNQRQVSNTHSHSGVPRLCVIVRQVVSMYLGRSWVRCLKLKRRIMRTHTMCKHLVISASSVASGVLTCLSGEQERKKLPDLNPFNHSHTIQGSDLTRKKKKNAA